MSPNRARIGLLVATGLGISSLLSMSGLTQTAAAEVARPGVTKQRTEISFSADDIVLTASHLYVRDGKRLLIIDRGPGRDDSTLSLNFDEYDPYYNILNSIKPLLRNGLVRIYVEGSSASTVLDLAEPAHPVPVFRMSPLCMEWMGSFALYPGGGHAVVADTECLFSYELDTGQTVGARVDPPLPGWIGGVAFGGREDNPVLLMSNRSWFQGCGYQVFDATRPEALRLMSQWNSTVCGRLASQWLVVDRSGTLVVTPGDRAFEVRSASSAALLASIPAVDPDHSVVTLAEGGGVRVLAIGTSSDVSLWNLADPSRPILIQRIEGAPGRVGWDTKLTASPDEPLLFYATPRANEVRVVDLRTGSIVSRWSPPSGTVQSVILSASPGQSRHVVVYGDRDRWGASNQADIVDFTILDSPRLASRFVRPGLTY